MFKVPQFDLCYTNNIISFRAKYVGKVHLFIFRCYSCEIFKHFWFLLETELKVIINVAQSQCFLWFKATALSCTLPQLPQDRMFPPVHQYISGLWRFYRRDGNERFPRKLNFSSCDCKTKQLSLSKTHTNILFSTTCLACFLLYLGVNPSYPFYIEMCLVVYRFSSHLRYSYVDLTHLLWVRHSTQTCAGS